MGSDDYHRAMRRYLVVHTRCECCGQAPATTVHHRWPQSRWRSYPACADNPEAIHSEANLCAVCLTCHARWDDVMGQAPSPAGRNLGFNYQRLLHRHPLHKWQRMAADFILDAYAEYLKGQTQ